MNIKAIDDIDRELLKGIRDADPKQVKKVYDSYLPIVIRYIKDNKGVEADARDIFQDTIMIIYNKLTESDLILTVPFKTFLMAVCRNLWLSKLRYKRSKPMQEAGEDTASQDPNITTLIEKQEREGVFYKHFSNLGQKCREILIAYFKKVPMKEISRRFNTTESYIKKRKHACKEQLVKAIKSDARYKEMVL